MAKFSDTRPTPKAASSLGQRGHHQLDQTVVGGGITAHQVEGEAVAAPRHKAEEGSKAPSASCASTSTHWRVQRVRQPAERHGEASFVAAVASPPGGVGGQLVEVGRVDIAVTGHACGVSAALQPADGLPDRPSCLGR